MLSLAEVVVILPRNVEISPLLLELLQCCVFKGTTISDRPVSDVVLNLPGYKIVAQSFQHRCSSSQMLKCGCSFKSGLYSMCGCDFSHYASVMEIEKTTLTNQNELRHSRTNGAVRLHSE